MLLDGASGEAYNVSGDEGKTLGGYAEFMAELAGKKVVYDIEDIASVSKATYALMSTEKIKNIGWKPMYTVSDGLRRAYKIYKERINLR